MKAALSCLASVLFPTCRGPVIAAARLAPRMSRNPGSIPRGMSGIKTGYRTSDQIGLACPTNPEYHCRPDRTARTERQRHTGTLQHGRSRTRTWDLFLIRGARVLIDRLGCPCLQADRAVRGNLQVAAGAVRLR